MDVAGAASKSGSNSFMSTSTSTTRRSMDAIVTLEDNDYEECIKTTMQVYKSRGVQCVMDHENRSDQFPKSPPIRSTTKPSGFKINREKFKHSGKPCDFIHVPKVDCDSLDKWEHDMYYKLEGIEVEEMAIPADSCKCEKRRDVYKPPMLRNCGVCGSTAGELPDPRASITKDTTSTVEVDVQKYVTDSRASTAQDITSTVASDVQKYVTDPRTSTAKNTTSTVASYVQKYVTDLKASTAKDTALNVESDVMKYFTAPRTSTTKDTTSTVESDVMKYVIERRNRLSGSPKSSTETKVPKVEDKLPIVTPKGLKPSILKVRERIETKDLEAKKDRRIAFDLPMDSNKVETKNEPAPQVRKRIESREEFFKSMEFLEPTHTSCIRVRPDMKIFDVLDKPDTEEENVPPPPPPSGPIENKSKKAVDEYRVKVAERLRVQNLRKSRGTGTPLFRAPHQMTLNPMIQQHFFPFQPQPFVPVYPQGFFPKISQQYRLFKHKPNESLVRYR